MQYKQLEYHKIQLSSGIIRDRVLNGELYAGRF